MEARETEKMRHELNEMQDRFSEQKQMRPGLGGPEASRVQEGMKQRGGGGGGDGEGEGQ
jgi:hypothetical protein